MIRYLDTSAIAKVVLDERHTQALRTALSSWSADELVSSQLMATELHRVMTRLAVPQAAAAASAFELIELELGGLCGGRDLAPLLRGPSTCYTLQWPCGSAPMS